MWESRPRYENPNVYFDGSPPQGLFEARQGKAVSVNYSSFIRRGGVPSGAAAFIIIIQKKFQIRSEYADFHGKSFFPRSLLLLFGRLEGDSLSPPEGEATQGEHPFGPPHFRMVAQSQGNWISVMLKKSDILKCSIVYYQ